MTQNPGLGGSIATVAEVVVASLRSAKRRDHPWRRLHRTRPAGRATRVIVNPQRWARGRRQGERLTRLVAGGATAFGVLSLFAYLTLVVAIPRQMVRAARRVAHRR